MRLLLEAMFTREEQQSRLVKNFSAEVSQSLSTADIMEKMGQVVSREIPIEQMYICLLEGDSYQARYCSSPLATLSFSISKDSPQIAYLKEQESYLIIGEFRSSPRYLSVWEAEKELFRRLNIDCVAAMRDGEEIVGLLLLSAKERGRNFNAVEIGLLETVSSIASIAMKNAALYRSGLPLEYALEEIRKGAGTQFDPSLAKTFAQLIRSRSIPLSPQAAARKS